MRTKVTSMILSGTMSQSAEFNNDLLYIIFLLFLNFVIFIVISLIICLHAVHVGQ